MKANFLKRYLVLMLSVVTICGGNQIGLFTVMDAVAAPTEASSADPVKILLMNQVSPDFSDAQAEFVNAHYDYVFTGTLSAKMRSRVTGPQLFLYRSIGGTWTGFRHLDWDHINSNETMFCHNTDEANPHPNKRILTIWDAWLMAADDIVPADDPKALNHWINYYAVTTTAQVQTYNYDGLFVDAAGHKLNASSVNGLMPNGYSDEKWRDARYEGLAMIKSYLPDNLVIFNGLHNGNGVEHSLTLTNGGIWEGFAFNSFNAGYTGEDRWRNAVAFLQQHNENSMLAIVSKAKDLTSDIQKRMFILSSYLLVHTSNVALYMIDLEYSEDDTIFYYPEYEIKPGMPLGPYTEIQDGLFIRSFDEGIVLVNPSPSKSTSYFLDRSYRKVVPMGGGALPENGISDGILQYELVSGTFTLPPVSGYVLLKDDNRPDPPTSLRVAKEKHK